MNKQDIRTRMVGARRVLSDRESMSKSIHENLARLPQVLSAGCIFCYLDFDNEVETIGFINRYLERKRIVVPYMEDDSIRLSWINSLEGLSVRRFGILEPDKKVPAQIKDIDVFIIPGLAFDVGGNRIGYGHGYFDRLLSKVQAPKVGLCYDFQILESLPSDPHDVRMDYLVSEKRTIKTQQQSF